MKWMITSFKTNDVKCQRNTQFYLDLCGFSFKELYYVCAFLLYEGWISLLYNISMSIDYYETQKVEIIALQNPKW